MCDRVPLEPGDTGTRVIESEDSTQYGIISNIHFNDTSAMISQNVLPELQIERQQVTTVPEIEDRG